MLGSPFPSLALRRTASFGRARLLPWDAPPPPLFILLQIYEFTVVGIVEESSLGVGEAISCNTIGIAQLEGQSQAARRWGCSWDPSPRLYPLRPRGCLSVQLQSVVPARKHVREAAGAEIPRRWGRNARPDVLNLTTKRIVKFCICK